MNPTTPPNGSDAVTIHPPVYPMLARVVRYGDAATAALVLAVVVLGALWAWNTANAWLAPATLAAAAGIYVLARIVVELVRLVCDMLLPK